MNKYYKLIFGGILSITGIYFAFLGEDFHGLSQQFSQVHWAPFWLSVFLLIFSCLVRALRWYYILLPITDVHMHTLFGSIMIGYFGNNILPFRMGELLRSYSISSQSIISISQAFGTIILERMMDLVSVVLIFLMIVPWYPFEHEILKLGILTFTGITIILIFTVLFFYYLEFLDKIKSWTIFKTKLGNMVFNILNNIFNGLTLFSKTKHSLQIFILSVILWLIYYFSTYFVLKSCSIDVGFIGSSIILIIGGLIISIPSLPSSAGTYDAGMKYGLIAVYGISSEKALAYALISHAGMFFPYVLIGGIYFMLGSIHLKDINNTIQ